MNTYSKEHIQRAVALKYEGQQQSNSPHVVAKGTGDIAEEIMSIAKLHDILLHKDEALADTLSMLDVGQEIPENLYLIIAELIAFSYILQGKFPDAWENTHQKIDFES